MALASTTASNSAVQAVFATATNYYAALHTATPGTTGTSEQGAGSARGVFTVGAASAGSVSNLATCTVTTSGLVASTHLGAWDASTAGNYKMGAPLSSSVTAASVTFAVGAIVFNAA